MKTNKIELSSAERFQADIFMVMSKYFYQAHSESIKRGIALKKLQAKKLSTRPVSCVKQCKVL